MSPSLCRLLNLVLPGSGLIPVRREWLGLAIALLFAVCVNIWIAGRWIAPAAVPRWLSFAGLCVAVCCWCAAQALVQVHLRRFAQTAREVDDLLGNAARELQRGDAEAARAVLEAAAVLDNERPDVLAAEADMCDAEGDDARAEILRRRILRIAPKSRWAAAATARLSGKT